MGRLFTISVDELDSGTQVASTTQTVDLLGTKTARALEFWLDVTAIAGGTTVDFILETTIDGLIFSEQAKFSAVAATGVKTLAINRADQALGVKVRLRTVITGGSPSVTFSLKMGRME